MIYFDSICYNEYPFYQILFIKYLVIYFFSDYIGLPLHTQKIKLGGYYIYKILSWNLNKIMGEVTADEAGEMLTEHTHIRQGPSE